jgi:hypothetical protein
MTLIEFNALDEAMQYLVVLEFGEFVAHRDVKKYTYVLYQIDNFYAEVGFIDEQKEVVSITGFGDTNKLEPYLAKIELPFIS